MGLFHAKPKPLTKGRMIYLTVVVVVMLFSFIILRWQLTRQAAASSLNNPLVVLAALSHHMQLPAQTPSLTKIDDVMVLKRVQPEFYKEARNGDWVVRYTDRVILYRAETDKVLVALPIVGE
jgi:hypothetical protein